MGEYDECTKGLKLIKNLTGGKCFNQFVYLCINAMGGGNYITNCMLLYLWSVIVSVIHNEKQSTLYIYLIVCFF